MKKYFAQVRLRFATAEEAFKYLDKELREMPVESYEIMSIKEIQE